MENHSHCSHCHPPAADAPAPGPAPTIDPVCGMTVDSAAARGGSHEHAGTTYYFCNPRCRERFAAEPEKYLKLAAPAPTAAARAEVEPPVAGAIYVCPMDPEVRSDRPGPCPKCGMALEPLRPSLSAPADDVELRDMTRRLWFSLSLTVPLFAIAMGDMLPGRPISALLGGDGRVWVELALATPVCSWAKIAKKKSKFDEF